jgi:hypothetical protein
MNLSFKYIFILDMIHTLLMESSESSVQHFRQSDTNSAPKTLALDYL